jgi:hypothetical protein
MTEINSNFIVKEVLPRVTKAAIWGIVTFIVFYYVPMILIPQDLSENLIQFDYRAQLFNFAMISVFFAVAGQIFSKTIFGCGFGIAKAIIIILYFFMVSDGGIFKLKIPFEEYTLNFTLDISIILLMIVSVNVLSIAKNLFEAVNILHEKSTKNDLD